MEGRLPKLESKTYLAAEEVQTYWRSENPVLMQAQKHL